MVSPRWIVPGCVVALTVLSAALTACTASSPQPQPPAATGGIPKDDPTAEMAPGPSTPAGAAASANAAPEVPPQSVITNEPPPGGTVTANANPAAPGSDRMQAMMELIKANRDGYRKCFDLWGKKNPGQAGKLAFQFFLKADGTLEKAALKRDEGDVFAPEVESCMITFSKTLAYPKSTVGKETIYTHRFEFKATKQ